MEPKVIKADSLEDAIVLLRDEAEKMKDNPEVSATQMEAAVGGGPALCIEFEVFDYDVRLCFGWIVSE